MRSSSTADDFFPEVRRAEARYIPVHLKQTLQKASFWGTVRVVPHLERPERPERSESGEVDLTSNRERVARYRMEVS